MNFLEFFLFTATTFMLIYGIKISQNKFMKFAFAIAFIVYLAFTALVFS